MNELETIAAERADALADMESTIVDHPNVTIRPENSRDTAGERAIELLEKLSPTRSGAIELHDTIGEGGFGVVRLGTQVALGRAVAVKTLRPNFRTRAATIKLLREAWVTGTLEHPNVVPVYDVGIDRGDPVIVMKRIEGVSWSKVMHDPDALRERFGAEDALAFNLAIFVQLCNAVSYAHSRGIVHRDLKPDNVMIGSFGEVYLVDWGIAVSMNDDRSGRLPLAVHATELAGTPAYMAPEMLGGAKATIAEHTDVYLLGSILYEIAVGRAPHHGEHLMQIIYSVLSTPPMLPEGTSPELARIVRRAMTLAPSMRWESAEAMRREVEGFVRHRGSEALTGATVPRLDELVAKLSELGSADDANDDVEPMLHRLFAECRFGFQQALREWPENARAKDGLRRAIQAMASHELDLDDSRAALLLLSELEAPDPELLARAEAARRDRDAERARVARRDRDLDLTTGRRTRRFVGVVLVAAWILTPFVQYYVFPSTLESNLELAAIACGFVALIVALAVWARDSMTKTLLNRRVIVFALAPVIACALAHVGGYIVDVSADRMLVMDLLVFALSAAYGMFILDRRFLYAMLGYLGAFAYSAFFPAQLVFAMSAGHLVLLAVAVRANQAGAESTAFWSNPR